MTQPSRRSLLAALPLLALGTPARAAADFAYRDWRMDGSGLRQAPPDAVVRSLQAQCDIVDSLQGRIAPDIYAFFRALPLTLVAESFGGSGDYVFGSHRLDMVAHVDPPANPVLLHEMLHAFHDQRLGRANPRLRELYGKTQASRAFPAEAYMLKNPAEFFAMCGSVALWGRAARPPFTRDALRAKAPEVYAWIAETFAFTG